jgi:hypothetical protein
MGEYIERLQVEGLIYLKGDNPGAQSVIDCGEFFGLPQSHSNSGGCGTGGRVEEIEQALRQMIDSKKHAYMMVTGFYFCIIDLGFVYLLMIIR